MARNPETRLQIVVVDWLHACLPPDAVFWAVLNERKEGKKLGALRNRMGRRKGASDLMVLYRGRLFCIELKTEADPVREIKRGYQSPEQKQFQQDAEQAGAVYAVCRSTDDVEALLRSYQVPLRLANWIRRAA